MLMLLLLITRHRSLLRGVTESFAATYRVYFSRLGTATEKLGLVCELGLSVIANNPEQSFSFNKTVESR